MSCIECEPEGLPTGARLGEHHIAVRFGDAYYFRVFIGDDDVSDGAEEAIGPRGDEHGLVVLLEMPARICQCRGGVARTIYVGDDISFASK